MLQTPSTWLRSSPLLGSASFGAHALNIQRSLWRLAAKLPRCPSEAGGRGRGRDTAWQLPQSCGFASVATRDHRNEIALKICALFVAEPAFPSGLASHS